MHDVRVTYTHTHVRVHDTIAQVIVPSGTESEVQLSQVMVNESGLTIFKVPSEEVIDQIPYELVQGWWLDSLEEMTVVVTDESQKPTSAAAAAKGNDAVVKERDRSETRVALPVPKGVHSSASNFTREVKLKSKRAQDIADCMQEVVTRLLHERKGESDAAASATGGSGTKSDAAASGSNGPESGNAAGSPGKAKVGATDTAADGSGGDRGYVFLKSGFMVRLPLHGAHGKEMGIREGGIHERLTQFS